ncbi:uncharacterized protein CIMG_04085 [Coccidioides immitis RS]|uniref:Uncharacterized protein n=3 Tax=Coccidioides immitis TaxID=5501 RepID=J3KCR5_COCIM|nr:uncharacterized protein CIMG_04085 [Coccidioides immitis RS]EAS33061.3 hypothetical protein CIMG_04085 [Coccidioides immitis RS]KMP08345.1 hypothetical protein CIRG_08026 [Coccidioides immitis RMSCC 2394]KMU88670.1 hypothetical protein CIHG_06611 [Coccidioides immitis H538.4]TPX19988.1 hypothetical protein DIZ76_017783 [Coccidioides immitis]
MESLSHSRSSSRGFRSRRSYTSLQHISLAPLTSRFPLDDDDGDSDGPVPVKERDPPGRPQLPTTSYYSTSSVPTTPPVLSDSRNLSFTNLNKKRKSSKTAPLSDTGLDLLNTQRPPHHHRTRSHNARERLPRVRNHHEDNEWLLRAGLALATSAREEKGQSWLVKRESSTSLVSDLNHEPNRRPHPHRSQTARRHRSGVSTPIALSRRGSKSQLPSPRSSRASFMTAAEGGFCSRSVPATPSHDQTEVIPDFVEKTVRDEMRSIISQSCKNDHNPSRNGDVETASYDYTSRRSSLLDRSFPSSESNYSESESEEESEFGEVEMQRLTRQQGFGLGPWIDRLVEWALFNVEEETSPIVHTQWADEHDALVSSATARKEVAFTHADDQPGSEVETDCESTGTADSSSSSGQSEESTEKGAWADVRWLLRVARNAL